jgi:ribonuclease HII
MPDLSYEAHWRAEGFLRIAGIDEAGRGPLAGPVTAAAVILPPDFEHGVLNDSKQLSGKKRETVYADLISDSRVLWASAVVGAEEIDRVNILRATHLAMAKAFRKLKPRPDLALIDGRPVKGFPAEHRSIVKGDSLSLSIAAASIIAKVERDRFMLEAAERYPGYGFENHKGYGTAEHLEALRSLGPCPLHRRSFAPVAQQQFDFG